MRNLELVSMAINGQVIIHGVDTLPILSIDTSWSFGSMVPFCAEGCTVSKSSMEQLLPFTVVTRY
ncbi:hypothetical protein HGM15179_011281, partial [Zosterops borbonicus]